MMAAARAQIDNWYTHHPPEGPAQVQVYAEIRSKAKELAVMFDACVPACPDASAAHYKLREAVMAMNNAIACNR